MISGRKEQAKGPKPYRWEIKKCKLNLFPKKYELELDQLKILTLLQDKF